jgi:pyridoxine 5-phosphate synthase
MTTLSVNINKIALIRNSRGADMPNLLKIALDCERFGAQGITVHPRPDQRHVRFDDLFELKPILTTEFNIEGYPSEQFIDLVCRVKPAQVTLVPDAPEALTSNNGWDTITQKDFLKSVIARFKANQIRTSIFVNPETEMALNAADTGADRIELYTEAFAKNFPINPKQAIQPYVETAQAALSVGLGINAGHDLNLDNLNFFKTEIPGLLEVSIGHALVCDALYYGLQNTIMMYLRELQK